MRKEERYLAIATYVTGGLIVVGIAIWLFVTDATEQAERAAVTARREQVNTEYYGVPTSLKGLKVVRPRTGKRMDRSLPTGKLVVVFDNSDGDQLVDGYQEKILGSSIGLSSYHAYLLPDRRADAGDDVSGVVWLSLNHKTHRVNIFDLKTGLTSIQESAYLVIDAVVTDLEGNVWSDSVHETVHFVDGTPHSNETREEAKWGAVPEGVVQRLRENLGLEIWQASLPDLDVDRHKEWVESPSRERQRAIVP